MLLEILYRLVFLYGLFNLLMTVLAKVAPDTFMRILSWFTGAKVSITVEADEQEHDPLDPVVGCKCEKCQPSEPLVVATSPFDAHTDATPEPGCTCFYCHPGTISYVCSCHPGTEPSVDRAREHIKAMTAKLRERN